MAFGFKAPVKRRDDGTYELTFTSDERAMLRVYLGQLRDLLMSDDALLTRLFPPAYLDDEAHEDEYRQLMRGDLLESRFAAIEIVEKTIDERVIDQAAVDQWIYAVNALRLVVGTRLDVSEERQMPDADDPDYVLHVVYEELSWMLSHLVDAVSGSLPPPTDDT